MRSSYVPLNSSRGAHFLLAGLATLRRAATLGAVIAAVLVVATPMDALAQQRRDRNRAMPYFDPPRETVVTSLAALNSWTAALMKGVEKPAALFYGNAELKRDELGPEQLAQLKAGEALIIFGTLEDEWLAAKLKEEGKGKVPLVRLFSKDELAKDRPNAHPWLDIGRARTATKALAGELKQLYPNRASTIDRNLEGLDRQLEDLDDWTRELLKPFAGSEVLLERPGAELYLERYGIKVAGYLSPSIDHELVPGDITRVRQAASKIPNAVLLRRPGQLPVGLIRTSQEVPLRFVMFDPIESGEPTETHYITQMRQNAMNLALGLRAAREITAAFTPAPPKPDAEGDTTAVSPGNSAIEDAGEAPSEPEKKEQEKK